MGVIDKIAIDLSTKLGDKLQKSIEEKAVLRYGLFILIHTLIAIILTVLTGILTGMTLEIIISITGAWFKRYTGGVHATTPERCLAIGLILSLILSILCRYLVDSVNLNYIMLVGIFIIINFYYIINKKCPIPSKNKQLKKESTRKKLRKKAVILINIYTVLVISLYTMYIFTNLNVIKTIIVSCILGIVLQITALTEKGSSFISLLDRSFNIFYKK